MNDQINELRKLVSDHIIIQDPEKLNNYSVKGFKPKLIIRPETYPEICEIVKFCNYYDLAITPSGSGTKLHIGFRPSELDVIISLGELNKMLGHYEKDFIATAECGMTLSGFQDELKKKNQFLPLNPPLVRSGATLGGIIATNDYGPARARYGTSRELLLEIKVVRSDGKLIRGGAKVVKNVAGYDIPKLFVGSLGTLGILVESTFRLYPIPEYSKTFAASFTKLDDLESAVSKVLDADIVPTSVVVTNPELSNDLTGLKSSKKSSLYNLYVKIENTKSAVNDQINTIEKIVHDKISGNYLTDMEENILWDGITDFPYSSSAANLVLKTSVLIRNSVKVLNYLIEIAANLNLKVKCSANMFNGILIISLHGEVKNQLIATNLLRSHVSSLEGNITVLRCSKELDNEIDIWGNIGNTMNIMKKIKNNFDPKYILNPGRLIRDL